MHRVHGPSSQATSAPRASNSIYLFNNQTDQCAETSHDDLSGAVGYRRLLVRNADNPGDFTDRWDSFMQKNGRATGTPFRIKFSLSDFKFKIYLDEEQVFSMVYDGFLNRFDTSPRHTTEATFSHFTSC